MIVDFQGWSLPNIGAGLRSQFRHVFGEVRELLLKAKRGAGGGSRTLTGLLSPADFLTVYGFRRPEALRIYPVCGLDYPFTIPR